MSSWAVSLSDVIKIKGSVDTRSKMKLFLIIDLKLDYLDDNLL